MAADKDTANPFMAGFPGMTDMQAEGLAMFERIGNAMSDYYGQTGVEFMEFFNKRLQEDARTREEMMACKDISEFAEVQQRFVKTAMEQYSEETGKMVQMSNNVLEKIMSSGK